MPGKSLIGNLAVNLTLETAAFQRGATIAEKRAEAMRSRFVAAGKSVTGLGAALGVGIGVSALAGVARSAFDMASALSESAEKVGVTVEALQELRFAAQQTGVSEDQLATALNRLNKSMGDLQLGKKSAVDAFAQIGLAADDLKGKAPDEALRIIADALNKLPDAQQRVAVGSQIMGKSFNQLLPLINGGSAALDGYAAKARQAGIITAEEARKLDEAADSWERFKARVSVVAAKFIASVVDMDNAVTPKLLAIENEARALGEAISNLATTAVNAVTNMVAGIRNVLTRAFSAVIDAAEKKIDSLAAKFRWLYDVVVGHSYVPDMVDEIGAQMARLDQVLVAPAIGATTKAAEAFRNLQQETKGLLDRLFPEAAALNTFRSELGTLEAAMKSGILTADQYAAALHRLNTEGLTDIPLLEGAEQALGEAANDNPGQAVLDALGEIPIKAQAANESLLMVAASGINTLADGLAAVISGTAKLGDVFKTVAAQIIADLLRIQIQKMLMNTLGSALGLPGINFGGGLATGGAAVRGKTYLVGEEGPELFSPGVSGRVIANDDLRQAPVGDRSVTQNFNIYANDADSFRRSETQIARQARRKLGV